MKKYNIKDDTMNESHLQKMYNCIIYPRDSEKFSNKGFVNIDNENLRGTHWTCFYVKDNKSCYFDSFGGAQINFYLINYLNE